MIMPDSFEHFLQLVFPQQLFSPMFVLTSALFGLLVSGLVFYFVVKGYILPFIRNALKRFKPKLVAVIERPLLQASNRLSMMGPFVFYLATFEWFLPEKAPLMLLLNKVFLVLLYINFALLLSSCLRITGVVYNQQPYAKEVPIKGILQIIKLAIFIICTGLIISELINKSPLYLLSSLGALTAVLLLVFKDTIMGLVAGVQIATQRLVAHGDWIEMPQYGADGDVLEVGLHTVRVQNFDKTITTIPTYKLISDSFKNWRGMSESGGRRIKRSFLIDVNTITFVQPDDLTTLLEQLGEDEFAQQLQQSQGPETNLGIFRRYIEFYLKRHPMVNHDMTIMARQLAPSEFGVPMEVYCFSADKNWGNYERVQAGIIEHLLARLKDFDLKAFQRPSDHLHH